MAEGTVYDYLGRTVDLLLYDSNVDEFSTTPALMSLQLVQPTQSGAATTGIQKLAQRFLLEFLTDRGSLVYLANRGTTFMTELRGGYLRTASDVRDAFLRAELIIRGNLRRAQDDAVPADERYSSAVLLSADLTTERLSLRIQVVSEAGTDVTIIYPLRITPI